MSLGLKSIISDFFSSCNFYIYLTCVTVFPDLSLISTFLALPRTRKPFQLLLLPTFQLAVHELLKSSCCCKILSAWGGQSVGQSEGSTSTSPALQSPPTYPPSRIRHRQWLIPLKSVGSPPSLAFSYTCKYFFLKQLYKVVHQPPWTVASISLASNLPVMWGHGLFLCLWSLRFSTRFYKGDSYSPAFFSSLL